MNQLGMTLGVAGYYKFEAFKADSAGNEIPGTRRVVADWFPNLITDFGLNRSLTNGSFDMMTTCKVGSGSTAPAFTDTALVSQVATTASVVANTLAVTASAPYYGYRRRTYRFGTGVAAGNLSEVGISGSSGSLFSRALIADSGGSPTTLTILSDEILDVTYELRLYAPTTDTVTVVTEDGVDYTFTVRAALANTVAWCGASVTLLGSALHRIACSVYPAASTISAAITGQPSGTPSAQIIGEEPYTGTAAAASNTFRISGGLTDFNVTGGIGAILIGNDGTNNTSSFKFQIGCSPPLPKDSTKTIAIDFTLSLARVTP